ncbi:membrane protein insertase YidC [Dietzia sp.]|uniref:membrane protein insertase YidC n=1 Tax=Dietzia sp. TaxID=1871616 RepID=UPI002FD9C4B0
MSVITDNLIYKPISGILWLWHNIFSWIGGKLPGVENPESNGLIWALSVIFLVLTLRVILFYPMARQIRYSRKMQVLQPQMQEIRKRYKNDQRKMSEEMRNLQKKEGFNPLLGCLPALLQIPVFLGLFHVLRSFNRMGTSFGSLGMTAEETRNTGNYVFSASDVQHFLDARLFGAPLSSYVSQPIEQFQAFVDPGQPVDFSRLNIVLIAIPLMIISSVMTHFNARQSSSRQPIDPTNSQAAIMRQMMLWVFPIGILVTGAFWPIAILVYMMTNNVWTYGQQHFLYGQMDREDAKKKEEAKEKRDALAPRVGVKPVNPKKAGKASGGSATAVAEKKDARSAERGSEPESSSAKSEAGENSAPKGSKGSKGKGSGVEAEASAGASKAATPPAPGGAPKPGQRPQGAKKKGSKKNRKKR